MREPYIRADVMTALQIIELTDKCLYSPLLDILATVPARPVPATMFIPACDVVIVLPSVDKLVSKACDASVRALDRATLAAVRVENQVRSLYGRFQDRR